MAGSRRPGPQDLWIDSGEIEDGTLCRTPSPRPGPVGISPLNETDPGAPAGAGRAETIDNLSGRVFQLPLEAIRRETGCDVGESLKDRIPLLVEILDDLRTVSVPLSASAPFPRSRRICGLKDALAALDLNFLSESVNRGSDELLYSQAMGDARTAAWRNSGTDSNTDIIPEELSRSLAILTRLILQGIVNYLLKEIGSSQTAGKPKAKEVGAVTTLLAHLRSSKLGETFASWIAGHWSELLKNPRLRSGPRSGGGLPSRESVASARKASVAPAPPAYDEPTLSPDVNMAAQAATLVAAAAQGTPFCPM